MRGEALRGAAIAGVLMLLGACSEVPEEEWSGTIEDRDGVVWINNPEADPGSEDQEPPFSLVLEQTFGAENEPVEELLSFITGVTVDQAGNVYVVDRSDNRLVAFAPDGEVLWKGGRAGQGPGEFENAQWVAWDGRDLLYVDNHGGSQIDTWSTAGEYIDSQGLSDFDIGQGYVVGLPDPNTIVLSSGSRTEGDGAFVHVFNITNEWRRTGQFFARGGRLADSPERAFWATVRVRVSGGSIWSGNRLQYELHEYGLDGRLQRVIARHHAPLIPTFVYRGTGFGFGAFEPPLWLSDKHGLVARHWLVGFEGVEDFKRRWDQYLASGNREEDIRSFASALDLIDTEGRVLGSLPIGGAFWDSIGTLEAVGLDGRIYTRVFEPFPHVRRYRVEIDES